MLLVRYFIVTGSLLLGLLFLADWYLPPNATVATDHDIDRTIIRIHTAHKWPEAIQLDTSLQIVAVPPATAQTVPVNAPAMPIRQTYAYAPLPPQEMSEKVRRPVKPVPSSALHEVIRQSANYYQPSDPRNW
jgi:hypothetical protein